LKIRKLQLLIQFLEDFTSFVVPKKQQTNFFETNYLGKDVKNSFRKIVYPQTFD
jgi:hypothetical protein